LLNEKKNFRKESVEEIGIDWVYLSVKNNLNWKAEESDLKSYKTKTKIYELLN